MIFLFRLGYNTVAERHRHSYKSGFFSRLIEIFAKMYSGVGLDSTMTSGVALLCCNFSFPLNDVVKCGKGILRKEISCGFKYLFQWFAGSVGVLDGSSSST